MNTVVISQPMLFPWVGMFEQIRLADVYVHYDDVQYSKGSFSNRVQVKSASGSKWMTLPLMHLKLGQRIMEVCIQTDKDWRKQHLELLSACYAEAPYYPEMIRLVKDVYADDYIYLSELAIASMQRICEYFEIATTTKFCKSSELGLPGRSDQRVLDIVKFFQGNKYVTGHGAKNYLDHEMFDAAGIRVEYLDYQKLPYPQLFGAFTPYVTILDLIANVGQKGRMYLCSNSIYWRDFHS
jgi:hypothetical protein